MIEKGKKRRKKKRKKKKIIFFFFFFFLRPENLLSRQLFVGSVGLPETHNKFLLGPIIDNMGRSG